MAEAFMLKAKIVLDTSDIKNQMNSALGKVGLGGGGGGGAGSGGGTGAGRSGGFGALSALLQKIAILLAPITIFFDAVGPIIKVVFKVLSAVLLILLIPFLVLFMPLLKTGFKILIDNAVAISKGITELFKAFKLPEAIKKLADGDIVGFFLELLSGAFSGLVFVGTWLFNEITEYVSREFPQLVKLGQWVFDSIKGVMENPLGLLAGIGEWASTAIQTYLLPGIVDWMTALPKTIYELMVGVFKLAITSLGSFLLGLLKNAIGGFVDLLKGGINWLLSTVFGAINSIIGFLAGISFKIPIINKSYAPFSGMTPLKIPQLASGGFIEEEGIAKVHKGETVVPAGRMGMSYNPVYNINGMVDVPGLERLLRKHDEDFLSKLRQRTSTGGRYYNA